MLYLLLGKWVPFKGITAAFAGREQEDKMVKDAVFKGCTSLYSSAQRS